MKKIGIIGAGAWGTTVGKMISLKGNDVELWSHEPEVAEEINSAHVNTPFLDGVELPSGLHATTDIKQAALNKDVIIFAAPSLYILDTVKLVLSVPNIMEGRSLIGVVTKGFITIDENPGLIVETLENYLPGFYKNNLVYISGPSHAEEVAREMLTGLISASPNGKNSIRFRELLTCSSLIVFSSFDVIGVQICAAVKNVIAVAFGILDALKERSSGFGDNTESLLLAAGLNEIQLLGMAMGATHPETFTSIAGVGDLEVTCRSPYGRNRRFGLDIIRNSMLDNHENLQELIDHIDTLPYFPEGIVAAMATYRLAQQYQLKLPIITGVYRILNKEVQPVEELNRILHSLTGSSSRNFLH
jgi:glycerol-3-phosphate dehydrogenase (NAD(P)+)